jgi:hypothetical protein
MTAPELSPSARALLDAAREGMSPDAAAISRVRGKVTAAAGGAAASALVIKLGLAGVLAAVAVGAIVSQRGEAPMTPQLALPVETAPSPTPITRVHEVAPVEAPDAAEPAPIEMAAVPMRRDAPKLTVDIEPADLAREVELIDRAMKALATNDLRRALATVELHAAETRRAGQLAEDAAAIEIEALCRLRTSARTITAKLDAFDARFPRSAQRSRLSTHCEEN